MLRRWKSHASPSQRVLCGSNEFEFRRIRRS
jgi:hypothetical protein